jgi:hypothetical protein
MIFIVLKWFDWYRSNAVPMPIFLTDLHFWVGISAKLTNNRNHNAIVAFSQCETSI